MSGQYVLYTDGASRGNPGRAAVGAILYRQNEEGLTECATVSRTIGRTTNNVAEYRAVILGLEESLRFDPEELVVRTDSELLTRQLQGRYRVKAKQLKPLYTQVKRLIDAHQRVKIEHVPRHLNEIADGLANAALDR